MKCRFFFLTVEHSSKEVRDEDYLRDGTPLKSWFYQYSDDLEFLTYILENLQCFQEFLASVEGCNNGTQATLVSRYRGIHDSLCKYTFFKETVTEACHQSAFYYYHRRNGRLAMACVESKLLQAMLEKWCIFPKALDQVCVLLYDLFCCNTIWYRRGRIVGGETNRATALKWTSTDG